MWRPVKKNSSKKRQVEPPSRRPGPSYYSGSTNQNAVSSPFQKQPPSKKPSKALLPRLAYLALLVVIAAAAIFFLIVKPRPHVIVSSSVYHGSNVYETATDSAFKAARNHTKLTLDKRGIENSLKKQFPEIDNLKIGVPIFSQIPTVSLAISAPSFNFSSRAASYIVSSDGVITGYSDQLANASKLPSVIDQSGFEAAIGKQVLSKQSISFINSLLAQTARAGVKVQSLTLPAAPSELELRAQNQPYYVKFYLGGDVTLQAGQYLAAKHKFDTEGSQPEQYLDVRVAGKVYYH